MEALFLSPSLLFLASPREAGKRGTDRKGTGSNGACRAQTYRSAPDRPAPGARGGDLPRTVSVPFTVALRTWLTLAQALPAKPLLFHVLQSVRCNRRASCASRTVDCISRNPSFVTSPVEGCGQQRLVLAGLGVAELVH